MLVVLKEAVPNLGARGDVVRVADGYARNFLVPKGMGVPVSGEEALDVRNIRRQLAADAEKRIATAGELADKIRGVSLTVSAKATDEGRLYGSITQRDIAAALAQKGIQLDPACIMLEEHIKEVGVYTVTVALCQGVESTLKVWVLSEQPDSAEQ